MLTSAACKAAQPKEKIYRLSDGRGLHLEVRPNGKKYWRYRYRLNGRPKMCSLGIFPDVSLAAARTELQRKRDLVAQGIDPVKPSNPQPATETQLTFETLAREWYQMKKHGWTDKYARHVLSRLSRDAFPPLGGVPASEVTVKQIIEAMRSIESRGANEDAHKTLGYVQSIFQHGILTDQITHNPAAGLRGALAPVISQPRAHVPADELPALLKKIEAYDGRVITRLATTMLCYTFVRTSELRQARWDEFDIEEKLWRIPAERMKMKRPHLVPLSTQVLGFLKELKELSGGYEFVFPNYKNPLRPLSENAILYALYNMGYQYKATGHGFRHTASTILNESAKFSQQAIDRQMSHVDANKVRATYNHAEYLKERRALMQWWGDYLDACRQRAA